MKGTFFRSPLEFKIDVQGEAWHQGDTVQGTIAVLSHAPEASAIADGQVHLALGNLKKVKAKAADAFQVIASQPFSGTASLAQHPPQERYSWQFTLDINAPISDVSDSLFLLYGRGTGLADMGMLQLVVKPQRVIEEIVDLMESSFQFVTRWQKHKNGTVEIKFSTPEGRAYASLEHLFIYFHQEGADLVLKYVFQVKRFQADGPGAQAMSVKKTKKELEQRWSLEQTLGFQNRLNREQATALLDEALADYRK